MKSHTQVTPEIRPSARSNSDDSSELSLRNARALEIARDLRDESDRHYTLASAICDYLKPAPGEEAPAAFRLAEVLCDLLVQNGQLNRLIALLADEERRL